MTTRLLWRDGSSCQKSIEAFVIVPITSAKRLLVLLTAPLVERLGARALTRMQLANIEQLSRFVGENQAVSLATSRSISCGFAKRHVNLRSLLLAMSPGLLRHRSPWVRLSLSATSTATSALRCCSPASLPHCERSSSCHRSLCAGHDNAHPLDRLLQVHPATLWTA